MFDPNLVFIGLLALLLLVLILIIVLKPWYQRSVIKKDMEEEIKIKRMQAQVAEQLATRYQKKGRL